MQTSHILIVLPLFALATVRAASNCQFYHFNIGDINATVISDGLAALDVDFIFPYVHPDAVKRAAAANFRPEDSLLVYSNPLHLDMGDRKVIIDVGSADRFVPTFGKLLDNMAAAGLDPEQVDDVVLTHANLDHAGGLIKPGGGGLAFPNARVHISRDEVDFWSGARLRDLPKHMPLSFRKSLLEVAQDVLTTVSDKLVMFDLGDEVVPGITSRFSPGHSPGHAIYLIKNGDHSLMHLAEAVPWEIFSIQNPDWEFALDFDIRTSVAARFSLLEELVESGTMVFNYHNDFPGLGHIVRQGQTYALKSPKYEF